MRVDVHRPRFSLLHIFVGGAFAVLVALAGASSLWSLASSAGCTAGDARDTTFVAKTAADAAGVPIAAAALDGLNRRFAELEVLAKQAHEEAVAAGKEAQDAKPKKMPWEDWVYGITGAVLAGSTIHSKIKAAENKRNADLNLTEVASAVASLLATPKGELTPEAIAHSLSDALPGEHMVPIAAATPVAKAA